MKNILKKLGVLILIMGLMPILRVDAVSASCEGGELHLQNYLFLGVSTPEGFYEYENEVSTYGNFPYTFPESNDKQTVRVTKVTENHITSTNEIQMYWSLYQTVLNYSNMYNVPNFHTERDNQGGRIFVSENNPNYVTDTIILHKSWGEINSSSEISDWPSFGRESIPKHFQDAGTSIANNMLVSIDGATYLNNRFNSFDASTSIKGSANNYTNLANYLNNMINGTVITNTKWYDNITKHNYIPLVINRRITESTFNSNGVIFGAKNKWGDIDNYVIYSLEKIDESKIDTSNNIKSTESLSNLIKNSYKAFKNYLELENKIKSENQSAGVSTEDIAQHNQENANDKNKQIYIYYIDKNDERIRTIDFLRYENYYWPFVLNVEYEVCPINETPKEPETPVVEQKWKLKYDADVEDITTVTNMPKDQIDIKTEETTIDTLKPERSDWTFKQWCTEKNGKGDCYNPGDKIKSSDKKDKTLFAYWVDTKAGEQETMGVVSYIIGFSAIALVAGGIFLISKKKNLFKQI